MRKLTDKVKFVFDEDNGATLYAKLKGGNGKFQPFGTCHASCVSAVLNGTMTFEALFESGLIRFTKQA